LGSLPDSCGTPLYPSPAGGLRLPADKHISNLTDFQTLVNKKIGQKRTFFGHPREGREKGSST